MTGKGWPKAKRILVVDQDPTFVPFLREEARLRQMSCRFEEALTFSEAVQAIFSGGYDLVLLDFPGIRGPYLINLALLRRLPVVVLASSSMFPLEAHHLREGGVQEILPRESPNEIVSFLSSALSASSGK